MCLGLTIGDWITYGELILKETQCPPLPQQPLVVTLHRAAGHFEILLLSPHWHVPGAVMQVSFEQPRCGDFTGNGSPVIARRHSSRPDPLALGKLLLLLLFYLCVLILGPI